SRRRRTQKHGERSQVIKNINLLSFDFGDNELRKSRSGSSRYLPGRLWIDEPEQSDDERPLDLLHLDSAIFRSGEIPWIQERPRNRDAGVLLPTTELPP